MGAWGYKLYECDLALDLEEAFKDWKRLPYDGAELLAYALQQHPDAEDTDDEYHSIYWLVLADQFHRYGIEHKPLFERAISIIDRGEDIANMRELEMDESDLKNRARELERLKAKWSKPHPKPRNRKMLTKLEPPCVEPGEIWVYPTQDASPADTFDSEAEIKRNFHPDGWSAFVIGATGREIGNSALAYYIRLYVDGKEKPDFEACRQALLGGVWVRAIDGEEQTSEIVGWAKVTRSALKKMRAEKVGKVDLSWPRICARLRATGRGGTRPPHAPISLRLGVFRRRHGLIREMSAVPLNISLPDLMED